MHTLCLPLFFAVFLLLCVATHQQEEKAASASSSQLGAGLFADPAEAAFAAKLRVEDPARYVEYLEQHLLKVRTQQQQQQQQQQPQVEHKPTGKSTENLGPGGDAGFDAYQKEVRERLVGGRASTPLSAEERRAAFEKFRQRTQARSEIPLGGSGAASRLHTDVPSFNRESHEEYMRNFRDRMDQMRADMDRRRREVMEDVERRRAEAMREVEEIRARHRKDMGNVHRQSFSSDDLHNQNDQDVYVGGRRDEL